MSSKKSLKFGDVVSAIRKEMGLTQYDFCKYVGMSQANLSKIEANQFQPPADTWIELCDYLSIPFDSYKMGYIDSLEGKTFSKKPNKSFKKIDMPSIYKENAMLKVRFLIPIFENLKFTFGENEFFKVLLKMGIDPHLLNIRDTVLNFYFVNELLSKFQYKAENFPFVKAAELAAHDFVHGKIWSRLKNPDVAKASGFLVKKIGLYVQDYYIQQENYSHQQLKMLLPPFSMRPSFIDHVSLIEKINYEYLPNYIKSLLRQEGTHVQVQFIDEGPTFQIFVKGS